MENAIRETERRRGIQQRYNEEHHITPKTITKDVSEILEISTHKEDKSSKQLKKLSRAEKQKLIEQMKREMKNAAKLLEFEHAAYLRDRIRELEN